MAKKKRIKTKKTRKQIIIRYVLVGLLILILSGLALLSPTLIKVLKYQKEAKSLIKSSTYNTFKASQSTIIYDTNNNELCKMSSMKDLYYLNFSDIPKDIVNSFVTIEDQKYYSHNGIDIKAIFRAVIANQKSNDIEQGASTITQQLARNIFLSTEVTWERKVKEAFIAMELDKKYSKEDILEFYLNNIYFANGYYGIEAASRGYFSKSVKELTLSQQAFLAAIPNSPTRYDPIEHFEATDTRKKLILKQLYENDKINEVDYNNAINEVIILDEQVTVKNNSVETYVRRCATESMMAAFGFNFRYNFDSDDDYNNYKESYDANYALFQKKLINGGYSIYTSIDLSVQEQLQKAVDDKLAISTALSNEGVFQMQGAATCIDNSTGNVIAIVGGRSQELSGYTLNRAYQSYRQPGSSIKPLSVYTPFLQLGNTPDTVVVDEPIEGGPNNADQSFSGAISLREAVRVSKNTVAWKVYQQITPQTGSAFLMNLQFKKTYKDKNLLAGSLGGFTYGVTTEEMAGGYATLANEGVFRKPTCITIIKNTDDKIICDERYRGSRVYDTNATRMMTDMLKTVVKSGTGVAANIDNGIVAGKTGTTNSNKDAWFVGYSKYYTTSIWVGYDMPQTISSPGTLTCGIFKQFMKAIHNGLPVADFTAYTQKQTEEKVTQAVTEAVTEKQTETQAIQPSTQEIKTDPKEKTTESQKETKKTTQPTNPTKDYTQKETQSIQAGDVGATVTGGDKDAEIKIQN